MKANNFPTANSCPDTQKQLHTQQIMLKVPFIFLATMTLKRFIFIFVENKSDDV